MQPQLSRSTEYEQLSFLYSQNDLIMIHLESISLQHFRKT